jgi:hypothetical protein
MPNDNQRAGSIRSVASNSSIASGASLTRRSRTRTRAKTLTGGSLTLSDIRSRVDAIAVVGDLLFLDRQLVDEPVVDITTHAFANPSSAGSDSGSPPPRPPRSLQRPEGSRTNIVSAVGKNDERPGVLDFLPGSQQNVRFFSRVFFS